MGEQKSAAEIQSFGEAQLEKLLAADRQMTEASVKKQPRSNALGGSEDTILSLLQSVIIDRSSLDCGDDMAISPSSSPILGSSPKSWMNFIIDLTTSSESADVLDETVCSNLTVSDRDLLNINFISIFSTVSKHMGDIHTRSSIEGRFDSILRAVNQVVNNFFSDDPFEMYKGTVTVDNFKLLLGKRELLLEASRYLKLCCTEISSEFKTNFESDSSKLLQLATQLAEYRQFVLSLAKERLYTFRDSLGTTRITLKDCD